MALKLSLKKPKNMLKKLILIHHKPQENSSHKEKRIFFDISIYIFLLYEFW